MNRQIQEFICQQQEYEFLKHTPLRCLPNNFFHGIMTNTVIMPCLNAAYKKRKYAKILNTLSKIVLILYLILIYSTPILILISVCITKISSIIR